MQIIRLSRLLLPAVRFLLITLAIMSVVHAQPVSEKRNLAVGQPVKRIALVIGNDAYQNVSKLEKAGNDATAMARELKSAGFEVLLHRDLNYRGMVKAVEALAGSITGGDQVVVFFAGHGVQIKSGSYLLPIDIEATSESEVEKTAYGLNDLTEKLAEAKAAFTLVMVDACRDNPLKSRGRSVGGSRGLSAIEPPKGQMVVYSASRGQQALDSLNASDRNPNGIFTREFIKQMKRPGVRIEDLVREVQESVETLARSVSHEQRPAIYNEARGNFYFFGPTAVQPNASGRMVPIAGDDPDTALWKVVELGGSAEEYEAYLRQFPKGKFAVLAPMRIEKLNRAAADQDARTQQQQAESLQREEAEAQVKIAAQKQAEMEARQRGRLIVFREGTLLFGLNVKIAILVDGVRHGTLTAGGYLDIDVPAGTRRIVARRFIDEGRFVGQCDQTINVVADQRYFFRIEIPWGSECMLEARQEGAGASEISSLVKLN